MEEVSAKVLTETRRGMERDGLIEGNLHPVATPQVEYGLTETGRNVLIPLRDLGHRAKTHRPTSLNATPPASGMTRSNWARSQTL
jgi:DNA-binding HxlR family transcriptional regulator